MILNKLVLLTIVGTATVSAGYLPRKIRDESHGWGYSLIIKDDGSSNVKAHIKFSWDFDLNCARMFGQKPKDYTIEE
jgi:hypothetical protein